ncbi:MAG: hypothetical protein ACR2GA_04475 [Chloroflexota bacterium]
MPALVQQLRQTGRPGRQTHVDRTVSRLVQRMQHNHQAIRTPRLAPMMASNQVTSAASLVLPVPSGISVQLTAGGPVADIGQLDNSSGSGTSGFSYYHNQKYVNSGVTSAVQQVWRVSLSDQYQAVFTFAYLATVYPDADTAANRELDAIHHLRDDLGVSLDSCSNVQIGQFININNQTCAVAVEPNLTDQNGELVNDVYIAFVYGNVFVEMDFAPKDSDIASNDEFAQYLYDQNLITGQADRTVTAVVNAAYGGTVNQPTATTLPTVGKQPTLPPIPTATARPTNTPVPTSTPAPQPRVQIAAIEIGVAKGKKLVRANGLKSRQQGAFVASVAYLNPGRSTLAATIAYAKNGKVFLTKAMQRIPQQQLRALQTGGQTAIFADAEKFKSAKKTQHYTATVSVSLGSASDSNSLSFTVKPSCKTVRGKKVCR